MTTRLFGILTGSLTLLAIGCSASNGSQDSESGGSTGSGGLINGNGTSAGGLILGSNTGSTASSNGGFVSIGDPPSGPAGCTAVPYQKQLLPASLYFIVDRSGSMNCNLGTSSADCEQHPVTADATAPTRWSTINGAMGGAIDQLGQPANLAVGLSFFSNDDTCGVSSAPNVALGKLVTPQVDALKNALENADPKGGTPIVGATILGFKYLHQVAQVSGNRFVVLLTDGSDSCIDKYAAEGVTGDVVSRLLTVELPKARSVNIRTFVVGAPGSEPARGLLSKIALAGGTGAAGCDGTSDDPAPGTECHLDMTRSGDFASDLSNALKKITGAAALSCEFDVPKQPNGEFRSDSVNVDYYANGDQTAKTELLRDEGKDCAAADGWQYNADKTRIEVCGPTCDKIRVDANANVIVSVGCQTRVR